MSIHRDLDNKQYNNLYYNQMLRASEKKKVRSKKNKDFGSKNVDFTKYLIVPSGYESIAYTFYFLAIPYIVGLVFLYFYVAKGVHENFALLDLTSFLIIWAIGYEMTGATILVFIFISFIKHLKNSE